MTDLEKIQSQDITPVEALKEQQNQFRILSLLSGGISTIATFTSTYVALITAPRVAEAAEKSGQTNEAVESALNGRYTQAAFLAGVAVLGGLGSILVGQQRAAIEGALIANQLQQAEETAPTN